MALINDDLSGMGLLLGNIISAILCGGAAFGIAYAYYGDNDFEEISYDLVIGLTVYGVVIGMLLVRWCSLNDPHVPHQLMMVNQSVTGCNAQDS